MSSLNSGLRLVTILLMLVTSLQAIPCTERTTAARNAFQRAHPCPSNGLQQGPCPGYVVDHVVPLCAGGPDDPKNMQWQTISAAKEKDIEESSLCRKNNASSTSVRQQNAQTAYATVRTSQSCPCSTNQICHGPRGGKYCITPSGAKRYGR